MKLSRALLIVLVLHIVAVAGIVAFNTIKTRESGDEQRRGNRPLPPVTLRPPPSAVAKPGATGLTK